MEEIPPPQDECDFDFSFNIGIVGPPNVGKTSIFTSLGLRNSRKRNMHVNIDYKFYKTNLYFMTDGVQQTYPCVLKIYFIDFTGDPKYRPQVQRLAAGCASCAMVCDVTSKKTFSDIEEMKEKIDKNKTRGICKMMFGNKCDLSEKRQVSSEECLSYGEQNGIYFYEVSAMSTPEPIVQAVSYLIDIIVHRLHKPLHYFKLHEIPGVKIGKRLCGNVNPPNHPKKDPDSTLVVDWL